MLWKTLIHASILLAASAEALQGRRLLQEQHSSKAFLHIYSALHDPVAGAVRVFADAYPDPQCTDIQSCHVPGEEAWPRMAARAEVPFPRLRAPSEPEPMECIITCQLPPGHEHTNIERLALRDAEGAARATLRVERIETLEKKRGWGICVGPVFSDVPQYEDWLAHHEQMGVEGIHVYVANLDAERARDTFGRGRPGTLHVTLARRHDVSMLEFFQADEGLPTHYYSQFIVINECIWRHRQTYDFLAYIDRDEFIHVNSVPRKDVDFAGMLHAHLDGTNFASASLFTALYRVACGRARVPVIDARAEEGLIRPSLYEDYRGYDVWREDTRQPDFTNCSSDLGARIFKPKGRECHTKSIVRPLLVDYMITHYVGSAVPGHEGVPKPLPTEKVFLKHVRCQPRAAGGEEGIEMLCQRKGPVNHAEDVPDGVEVCPHDE